MTEPFDVIVVGTGFASSFFLLGYLERAPATARVLVLERGFIDPPAWQIENSEFSRIAHETTFSNHTAQKPWLFTVGFGGGSNCWWACTPRMLPNDFRVRTLYGVSRDWPLSYEQLEPHYSRAEETMSVSGPSDDSPFERSRPYPQPPHRFTAHDELFKQAYPDRYFVQPTARSRIATTRGACCATGTCHLCPVYAKFMIQHELHWLYADPRVTLEVGADVERVVVAGQSARGVSYTQGGRAQEAQSELVVLGANAIFNPAILLRSQLDHPLLGRRLNEQVGIYATVNFMGVDGYQGSTSITGHGYMLYDGPHRSERAACLIEGSNMFHSGIRLERGRWRQSMQLKFIFEDVPDERNYVRLGAGQVAETVYEGHSAYMQRSIDQLPTLLERILAPLPAVEGYHLSGQDATEAHIQGTAVMGDDPATSIVDRHLVHHQVRNLLVLGSGAFPSCSPANPSLTIAALSLWAVDHL